MGLIDWFRRLLGRSEPEPDVRPVPASNPGPEVRRSRDEPTTFIDRAPEPVAAPVERTEVVSTVVSEPDSDRTTAVEVPEATEALAIPVIPEPAAEPAAATGPAHAEATVGAPAPAADPDATLFLAVPEPAPNDSSDETLVLDVPSRVVARLDVVKGELQGEQYELRDGENTLGRAPESDVVLPSMWISRSHAIVNCIGGRIELVPLTDKITSVNGEPASGTVELEDGATLQLGGTVFRLEVEA